MSMNKFQMEFNEVDLSDYLKVEGVRRPFLPSTDFITEKVMGNRGDKFFARDDGPSKIEVDVRIIKDNRKNILEIKKYLQRFLYTDMPAKVVLRDNPDVYTIGIIGGTDLDIFLRTGKTTLDIICHDPTVYSRNEYHHTLNTGDTIIYNRGTYPTRGFLSITGATGTDLEVRNVTIGEYVRIVDSPKSTDRYEIDFLKEQVKKNGVDFMKNVFFTSDFFDIVTGENKLRLSSGTGLLTYREQGYDG